MKNNYEILQSSGLDIFVTNQSSRYNPSIKWGNGEIEHFISLAKKLEINLVYAYLQEVKDADPILQELGFHFNEIFHFFDPSIYCYGNEEKYDNEKEGGDGDQDQTSSQEEKDLNAFLGMDSKKIVTEITNQFKEDNISKFESLKQVIHPYWMNLGINSEYLYYDEEILNKLKYINVKVAAQFATELMTFQQKLRKSDVFKSDAISYFQEAKFKSIKKMHLEEYLKSVNILTELNPLFMDTLLNTINDGLKIARKK